MLNLIDLGVGVLAIGGDLAYKDGPLMTVEQFREVYAPHIKPVADVARKRGVPFIKHSDGNLNHQAICVKAAEKIPSDVVVFSATL